MPTLSTSIPTAPATLRETSWILQETPATEPATPPASPLTDMLFPIMAVMVVFWFVMIGPERKNRKKREAMLAALKKGDRVMTTGGIYGTVAQVQGTIVTLAIADGVRVRFSLQAIQGLEEERTDAALPAASTETKS